MRAIFFKELRENAKWAAADFAGAGRRGWGVRCGLMRWRACPSSIGNFCPSR